MADKIVFDSPRAFKEKLKNRGLHLGIDAIYGSLKAGTLKAVKNGNRFLIPETELTDFPQRLLDLQEAA